MDCITVEIVRSPNQQWGIQVSGEAPCYIDTVKPDSPADEAGIKEGDCIFNVNGVSVHDASHEQVVTLIAESVRVVRFKLLPALTENESNVASDDESGSFWTDDISLSSAQNRRSNYSDSDTTLDDSDNADDDSTFLYSDADKFSQLSLTESDGSGISKAARSDHTSRRNNGEAVEQSKFIITRESQKDFDKDPLKDCTFKGGKASVAGAFTGDHNVIRSSKDENDIRGVRARVKAGIQHFSYDEEQEKINPEDKGKIIIYTTSLGIYRTIAHQCDEVRRLLESYRVKFEERDIFNFPEFKDELYERLGLDDGDPFPEMPRVYIDGVYMGGARELQEMSDCGDLRIRLKEYPKYNLRSKCPTCNGTGLLICHSCKGKAVRRKNRFAMLKCATCRKKGTVPCLDCRE